MNVENDKYIYTLKKYWGYDSFRGIQYDIIDSIMHGKDTLGLMPTGGGKSITFQVPAMCQEGICIVVTPLIALMKDQVLNLKRKGIKAVAVYSGLSKEEIIIAFENCIFGNYKFLYISPERLGTELFIKKLSHMNVSFVTVDEAHCISQWGYDFRPSYLKIAEIRKYLPDKPVLALTATATKDVVKDIQKQLCFKTENVFRMSFERSNLSYIVRKTENKIAELIHILKKTEGSAIVYTRDRKGTKEVSKLLNDEQITSTFYHAGLNDAEKDFRQKQWNDNKIRAMVATNAFGMGIDKPDVKIVLHMDMPDSIEAYFQEAGRAGRNGEKAYAILLYRKSDRSTMLKRIPDTFPEKESIRNIYEHLCYYFQMAMGDGFNVTREFHLEEFCRNFKHFPVQAHSALKILNQAGYIEYTEEPNNTSRLHILLRKDELYKLNELPKDYETVIQWILRSYGGLFSDYVYIDERRIATLCGLSPDQIYHVLVALTERNILHYIPRKHTPYITFTCKRVDKEHIVLNKDVYEKRKTNLEKRIKAMIEYASEEDICRSKYLLLYFGEETSHICKQCDICLHKKNSQLSNQEADKIKNHIINLLADKKGHDIQECLLSEYEIEDIRVIIRRMIEENIIHIKNGIIYKAPH